MINFLWDGDRVLLKNNQEMLSTLMQFKDKKTVLNNKIIKINKEMEVLTFSIKIHQNNFKLLSKITNKKNIKIMLKIIIIITKNLTIIKIIMNNKITQIITNKKLNSMNNHNMNNHNMNNQVINSNNKIINMNNPNMNNNLNNHNNMSSINNNKKCLKVKFYNN